MLWCEATSAAVPVEHQQPTFWTPETSQRERARKTKSSVDFQALYTWPRLPLDQVLGQMTRRKGKWHIDVAQVTLTDALASTLNYGSSTTRRIQP
ncbi:hypothetical protein N7509_011587 [Penicillium cosmopolitanum]|uniref:Uncharacterized protein n=1 Tax=Penicillium cosmopolitanum TaxID=1131564 RepID=A0A9W9SH24_9EURO|nr:uncharacterized protein N7509_011587 [Penicillium cosmopolitanum]KAJ5378468.1 hypothetical protein N7509_011587 [Penicillium cosmopolitanum]